MDRGNEDRREGVRAARIRAAARAVADLFAQAMLDRLPADRALASYFRANPRCGSRDRALVTESLYAIARWWGWLGSLAPGPVGSAAEWTAPDWERLMLAGLVCEGCECEEGLLDALAARCGASPMDVRGASDAATRYRRCASALGRPSPAAVALALLPEWSWTMVECPCPRETLADWLQRRPPLWLRAQRGEAADAVAALARQGIPVQAHPRLPHALNAGRPRVNLYTVEAYRGGTVEVQDLASQAVGHICAPRAGQRWWDACAGGGGKSLLLAQLMEGRGTVVASDVREKKLDELRRRARRAGLSNISPRAWDGGRAAGRRESFDGVLVDAPCSGSGTWRRNPAARWQTQPGDVAELADKQRRILDRAAGGVKPGGCLVYATCSMFGAENDAVVNAFLAAHSEFAPEAFANPLTGEAADGRIQTWPWDGDCDAMYVARLRRGGGA